MALKSASDMGNIEVAARVTAAKSLGALVTRRNSFIAC
jgi:hypothetical protein